MRDATWDDIVRSALLGTERAPLPVQTDTETALLQAAAVASQVRRAGRRLGSRPDLPLPVPAPRDEGTALGRTAAAFLQQMLEGHHPEVLPEWLDAVAAAGRVMPPESLPRLLERGRIDPDLRPSVLRVIGARGSWLGALNPEWDYAVAERADLWNDGRFEERLAYLRRLRAEAPEKARDLVLSTWTEDAGDARAAFIETFSQGLSMDDEPMLERALDDRRREVRRNAAALLSRLEGSRLVGRMVARLDPLLRIDVDTDARLPARLRDVPAFIVTLPGGKPDGCDEAMQRDGIEPRVPTRLQQIGERAWWMLQMLRCVPPRHWMRRFDRDAGFIARAAASSEFARLLLAGLSDAARAFSDLAMARALLSLPDVAVDGALFGVLPADERARRALETLKPPLLDGHAAIPLLEACTFPWDVALGQAFVRAVRASASVGAHGTSQIRALLGEASRWFPPSLAAMAALGWPPSQPLPGRPWLNAYDGFLAVVAFRAGALGAIDDPPV